MLASFKAEVYKLYHAYIRKLEALAALSCWASLNPQRKAFKFLTLTFHPLAPNPTYP